MSLKVEDLAGTGAEEKIDEFVKVPDEFKPIGHKEIPDKKRPGEFQLLLRFSRPHQPDIELWGHSMEKREDGLYVRKDQLERADELARKGK